MGALDIYEAYGFKFFQCKADKSPDIKDGYYDDNGKWHGDSWQDEKHHITKEQAEKLQSIGRMIGAWIPSDMIVIDIDRHKDIVEGNEVIKVDGAKKIKEFQEKYKFEISSNTTMVVKTAGGGRHMFFCVDREFKQGALKKVTEETKDKSHKKYEPIGIDIKTHKGYVIAAGSPGYTLFWDNEPNNLPLEFEQFIEDHTIVENRKKDNSEFKRNDQQKSLPVKMLKSILNKIDVSKFDNNDRWLQFIMSCISVAGNNQEVHITLEEWSKTDPKYNDDRSVLKRIESFSEIREITAGTFIHFLREENLSQYLINQVVKLNSISNILLDSESSEIYIPFQEPDYRELAQMPFAREFFETQGNTSAAAILFEALNNHVVYNESDKASYYFDGNKYVELQDYYGIIYTIIYRIIKILYSNEDPSKENNDLLYKCVIKINTTLWKIMTWKELCSKNGIYNKSIEWDSPKIKETLTTVDGVIDFTNGEIIKRSGYQNEFRKSFFNYTCDEIISAGKPEIFIKFFEELFIMPETMETAKYCVSLGISGNSGKRLFQMWEGSGKNGKSTLLETIKNILGKDKALPFNSDLLLEDGGNNESYANSSLAKFQGKYFCYSVEAKKNSKLSQNTIKKLTGDDTIDGKELYKNPINFSATWQLIYAVNDLPSFHGDDYAFLDRLLVLPFNRTFYKDEEDKKQWIKRGKKEINMKLKDDTTSFKESLYSEKAAVIKWMIDNYLYLEKELNGVIPESPECKIKKKIYIRDNDEVGIFIEHFCVIDETGKLDYYERLDTIADVFKEFTGFIKMSPKKIGADIMKYHGIIDKGVKWVIDSTGGGVDKKQKTVLTNIRLKNDKELNKESIENIKKSKNKDDDDFDAYEALSQVF